LLRSGPAAVEADLARSDSPTATRLRAVIGQNAHLLGPAEPAGALITTLTSRLGGIPELATQLPALRSGLRTWTAWPPWLPPDQPSDALIRVLTGHSGRVDVVAISPDGSWLATGGGTVRTWNADGTPRATLTGHTGWVLAVAISPDGSWLATASDDRTVRIWKTDGSSTSATAIRVDGILSGCAWFPGSTDLCVGGERGLYRFTLLPPAD
jgi:WD40 repeat protein